MRHPEHACSETARTSGLWQTPVKRDGSLIQQLFPCRKAAAVLSHPGLPVGKRRLPPETEKTRLVFPA